MARTRAVYIPPPYQDSAEAGRLILRDGTTATIRPSRPDDRDALNAFFSQLSPESKRRRFFAVTNPGMSVIDAMCGSSDPYSRLTLLVIRTLREIPSIIAAGSYLAKDANTAEVAFAVDDEFQGKGLGSLLLERLALLAVRHGFTRFWALTQVDNQPMLETFERSGFSLEKKWDSGCVEIDLSVKPTEASVVRSEIRDRLFTVTSLRAFFQPRSVAVIGASRDPQSIGHRILKALAVNQFTGRIYAVNPKAAEIESIKSYPSARDLPERVDLAIIVVSRDAVLGIVDDCAVRDIRALVVITAGFAEVGAEGRDLQRKLLEKVRGYGMRMVGPNCLGLLNADPRIRLNASFSPIFPPAGSVAMSSQSGALGLAALAHAGRRGLGLSTFVSVGNKADVSSNDLLQYWEEDANTAVILLYLESFGNPRRFARIARRVSRSKPIVAVKAGRTAAGRRAAGSHTAALAASDVAVEALFRQTGVIRAETLEEMFDLAALLGSQPLPSGRRVAIVTNVGGPAILCADACEAGGLSVPELSENTKARLQKILPNTASVTNPVDMIASATPDQYRQTVETILADGEIDSLIVIWIPIGFSSQGEVTSAICQGVASGRAAGGQAKPVLTCLMVEEGNPKPLICNERIPSYAFPEAPGRVLAKIAAYSDWRRQPLGMVIDFDDTAPEKASAVCRKALSERGPGWLSAEEIRSVLKYFGLPIPSGGVVKTADQAAEVARKIGFPVALKLASHEIIHKTEIGGVQLNLADAGAVKQAFDKIHRRLVEEGKLASIAGVLVQPMISGGVEVMVGVTDDPLFGPLIAFGLGGIHVEILRDVCFRVTPLTDREAMDMVREIRGYRLLEGYRGHPAADIEAIQEVLLRVSRLVEEVPEIGELDLNPIFALPPGQGCCIVDARICIQRGLP